VLHGEVFMALTWEKYGELADALEKEYPQEDLLEITNERVVELVNKLENFKDKKRPEDEELIDAVIYAWISMTDEEPMENTPSWA
jgi:FeS assembly protein IscX